MSWTASQKTVCSIGVFHLLLMVGELYPWKCPLILGQVLQNGSSIYCPTMNLSCQRWFTTREFTTELSPWV